MTVGKKLTLVLALALSSAACAMMPHSLSQDGIDSRGITWKTVGISTFRHACPDSVTCCFDRDAMTVYVREDLHTFIRDEPHILSGGHQGYCIVDVR
jgi:hypothetical protein